MKTIAALGFSLVMLGVGLLFIGKAGLNTYRYLGSSNWERAPALIESSEIRTGRDGVARSGIRAKVRRALTLYETQVTYRYEYDARPIPAIGSISGHGAPRTPRHIAS